MSDADAVGEGVPGIGRVEAFSDGVVAIIITIMVLEFHPPEAAGLGHLWSLWPTLLAYALSFPYVGLYWANHHRLFSHARRVTNALIWWNLALLFTLSLVPFATAYLGGQHFSRDATALYLVVLLLPTLAYVPLQRVIRRTGVRGRHAERYHRRTIRKGVAATLIYALGLVLTPWEPWLGIAAAALVAMLWFLPASPLDRLFDGYAGQSRARRATHHGDDASAAHASSTYAPLGASPDGAPAAAHPAPEG